MVLPVPGLPVNTRCRLWSSTGRSRSAADLLDAEQVRDEVDLVLDAVEADEGVELGQQLVERAGRGQLLGRGGRRGRGLGLGGGVPPSGGVGRAFPAARRAAATVACTVARNVSMAASSVRDGSRSRAATVCPMCAPRRSKRCARMPPSRASAVARTSSSAEARPKSTRRPTTSPASRMCAGVARPEVGRHAVAERGGEGPQLVVGVQAVGVDERARQVVRLDLDVGAQARRVEVGHGRAERLDLGGQVVDEGAHRVVERGGARAVGAAVGVGHCGSRHIGHIVGPSGMSICPETRKPKRS